MQVALVTVGDELLSGDTLNTNAMWLCEQLDDRGVDVERVTVVPDRVGDVARVVNEYRAEYDGVILTGGIGPTHDDVTMEGLAAAFGRDLVENQTALEWLIEEGGYAREDLVEGTTQIPDGARPLHNVTGVAPGAVIDDVYVLPGVPEEMKAMFDEVLEDFDGPFRHRETVHAGEPESALVGRIETLRKRYPVSVGSYPGDHVRLRIQGEDAGTVAEAAAWLRDRVESPDENE
ncbi:MAG: molybdenum cofactor synthesis domain-containing protein [Halobacteriales archaeon]|jgi:molybdenum cofactor synthesis domain-containing protein